MIKTNTFSLKPRRFSRPWWLQEGRNLVWVAVVTVLIWVFADLQFTDEVKLTARVQLNTGGNRSLVLISLGDSSVPVFERDMELAFVASGSRTVLERFRRKLSDRVAELKYDLSENYQPGENLIVVQTRDVIERVLEPLKAGVTVVSVVPESFVVRADQLVEIPDIPVELDYTGATLTAQPIIAPAKVNIRVAKSAWDRIRQSAGPAPKLKTARQDLSKQPMEKQVLLGDLSIIPSIAGVPVVPEPAVVAVTVEISQREATREITVSVEYLCPRSWLEDGTWREYKLLLKDSPEGRKTVRVTGEKRDVDRLDPKDVHAYIVLKEEDKKGSWWSGTVQVHFPDGFQVKLAGENPTLQYKLEKRSAVPAS